MTSGTSSDSPPALGLVAGRYSLEKVLGRGGMGVVWQARHTALNTLVAIKFLNRTTASEEAMRKRFVTEAQVTAQLKTRHAVQVFDFGVTDDGQAFLVMELMDGEPLSQRIERHKQLTLAHAVKILDQASRALDRAHAMGIVHRDFKPENIFITRDEEGHDQVKVMDFGVAKLLGDLEVLPEPEEGARSVRGPLSTFTRTGSMLGTPYYMAPEQIRNSANVGPPADVWAFAVVAFECLTGVTPFQGQDLPELFDSILANRHVAARSLNVNLPPAFDEWFARGCALDPAERFASSHEAVVALAKALHVPLVPAARISGGDGGGSREEAAALSDPFASTMAVADGKGATLATVAAGPDAVSDLQDAKVHPWSQSIAGPRRSRGPLAVGMLAALAAAAAITYAATRGSPGAAAAAPGPNAAKLVASAPPSAPPTAAASSASIAPGPAASVVKVADSTPPPEPSAPRWTAHSSPQVVAAAATPAPKPSATVVAAAPAPPPTAVPTSSSVFQLPPLGL